MAGRGRRRAKQSGLQPHNVGEKAVFVVERVDGLVCGWLEVPLWRGYEEIRLLRNGHEWRAAFFSLVLVVAALFPRLYSMRYPRRSHNHLPFASLLQEFTKMN